MMLGRLRTTTARDWLSGSRAVVVALAAAAALQGFVNLWWLNQYVFPLPPAWDQAWYLTRPLKYIEALRDGGLIGLLSALVQVDTVRVPLLSLVALPFHLLFGPSRSVAYFSNALLLFVLYLSVYLLASELYNRRAGLLAAFLVATFPAFVNLSRDYLMELPMAATVALSMYLLWRADSFQRRWWSLFFGFSMALVLLAKTMSFIFLVGPPLYVLVRSLVTRPDKARETIVNCVLAFALGGFLAGLWYVPNLRPSLGYLITMGYGESGTHFSLGGRDILAWRNLSFYAIDITNYGISFAYTVLLAGVALYHVGSWLYSRLRPGTVPASRGELFLVSWVLVGYALLTVIHNKQGAGRFELPILAPMAIYLAGRLTMLPWRAVRWSAIGLTIALGLQGYFALIFGLPGVPSSIRWDPLVLWTQEVQLFTTKYAYPRDASGELIKETDWKTGEIVQRISDDLTQRRLDRARVLVVPSYMYLSDNTLRYESVLRQYPLSFQGLPFYGLDLDPQRWIDELPAFDYLVAKTGHQGFWSDIDFDAKVDTFMQAAQPLFSPIDRFWLPDRSWAVVYSRRGANVLRPDGITVAVERDGVVQREVPPYGRPSVAPVYDPWAWKAGRAGLAVGAITLLGLTVFETRGWRTLENPRSRGAEEDGP